jgi:hypothetical protein
MQAAQRYNSCHPLVSEIIVWLVHLALRHKTVRLCWVPSHVLVEGNEDADAEARLAASLPDPVSNPTLPFRDFFPLIRTRVQSAWSAEWTDVQPNNNKLRLIKPNTTPWVSSSCPDRRSSKILTRLRIGHTLFSHGHLMEQRPLPFCEDCLVPLTVKHALAECPSYGDERRRCFPFTFNMPTDDTLREMLGDQPDVQFDRNAILLYLRLCNLDTRV